MLLSWYMDSRAQVIGTVLCGHAADLPQADGRRAIASYHTSRLVMLVSDTEPNEDALLRPKRRADLNVVRSSMRIVGIAVGQLDTAM